MRVMTPLLAAVLAASVSVPAIADDVVFDNVRIFDGTSDALSAPSNVLVKGNVIARISTDPIEESGAVHIAGNERTLMPGLIDAHWHAMLVRPTPAEALYGDLGLHQSRGRRRGDGHPDARFHYRARHGRPGLRPEARHRYGDRARGRASIPPER